MTQAFILVFLGVMAASFIQRVTGFGFGIFIMTILPFIMPSYAEATALSGTLALVTAFLTAVKYRKAVNWKKLLPILLTFIVVSFFAVLLLGSVNDRSLKLVLGVIMIAVSIYFFFISERIHLRPTLPVQLGMGSLSALMGGLFAMQGPPAVVYFVSSTDDKDEYIALTQWYFFIGNLALTFFRASHGFLTPTVGKMWLIGVPAGFLVLFLGEKVYKKLPVKTIRKVVYAYMALAGILTLFFAR